MVNEISRLKKLAVLESPVAKKGLPFKARLLAGWGPEEEEKAYHGNGNRVAAEEDEKEGICKFLSFFPSFPPLLSVSFTKGGKASLQDRASPAQKQEEKRFTFNSFF